LPCVIFTLASVPDTMKTLMQAYGAAVVACPTAEARWRLMRQGVERLGWYPTSGFVMPPVGSNPWGVEGYKTIAYEIAEDLGWTAPEVVVVPSAYSDGLAGVWKGWSELGQLGLVKTLPRMVAAEPFGPLAHALERRLDAPEVVEAPQPSVAFSIASRHGTWQGLAALRESGGEGVRITDEGIFEAQRALGREEGLFVEPSSAAALTAVMQLAARRALPPDAAVVVVLTSSGLKDPGASRAWLPAVPAADGDFERLLAALRDAYGLALDR
ncbi:MAG TPA: pyridoxal-phosphate dependent enzyme, partial [Solirubrobacter sp.]|nr:pyridoxal-phosphate dependent enzyme [Solirubrobacter sp.]